MGSLSTLSKVSALRRSSPGFFVKGFSFSMKFSAAVEHASCPRDNDGYGSRSDRHHSEFWPDSGSNNRCGDALGKNFSGGSCNWGSSSGGGGDRVPIDSRYGRGDDSIGMSENREGFVTPSGDAGEGHSSVNLRQSSGVFHRNADGINVHYGDGGWSRPRTMMREMTSHVEVSDQGQPGDRYGLSGMHVEVDGSDVPGMNRVSRLGPSSSMSSPMQSVGELESVLSMRGVGHNPPSRFASEYTTSVRGTQDMGTPSVPVLGGVAPEGETNIDFENSPLVGSFEELDAFCKYGKVKQAVEVLALLANKGVAVDLPRFVCLMRLCGDKKAIQEAKSVHDHVTRAMFPVSIYMCNRILEMYASCGSVDDARALFTNMAERNMSTWDIMITCLAKNGHGEDAIDLFTEFKQAGLKPDGQLFVSIFSACAAVGDVIEGMLHFESMQKDFGIFPAMEHYMSVVEMFGSAGHLDEALEFVLNMPIDPSIEIWEALMNLCWVHGYIDMGDRCNDMIQQLDSTRLTEQARLGLVPVGQSADAEGEPRQLEAKRTTYEYRAGDRSHPETDNIYALLRGLRASMKEAGYIPETKFVLHDIDPESKEEAILAHSEKLAVSYGVMTSPARALIRIIKNLRVCVDCHNAFKIISKLTGRTIVMRDAKRFHHFTDGQCSCKDFW